MTRYRIEGSGTPGQVVSQVLLVRVAPRVRLTRPDEPGVLTGTVRPRLPGALVRIERQRGSGWTSVDEVIADGSGAFRAEIDLVSGTYRARVAAAGGYVEGISPVLAVAG